MDLADHVQADQVVQADLVAKADQVVQAEIVQAEIVQADLAVLVRRVPVVDSQVPALQVEHQAGHQAADQVVVLTQLVVVVTQLAPLVNQVVGLQRVVSQSAQSVKSSTT